jgi:cleavage stimulation factor subunit 3
VARAEWENESASFYNMEQIFTRSLLVVPDVKLWSLYVSYIRRRNSMTTGDINKSYKIISDSFNFALNNVGMDKDSGRIWQDYIDFVKSGPGDVRGTGWQDTQKVDALRAAYQKAISVPMSALNLLWKEYDSFETGLSKINVCYNRPPTIAIANSVSQGRKFLQERSPAYMTARTCYTQLQNMTKDLDRTTLPKLPPAFGFEGDTEYMRQVEIWKSWIQWEKDDNLVLKDEDIKAYRDRIIFVYKQALMALQFWPEMWYDAADFCFSCGMDKEGLDFLNQGIAANPESCLLAFKLADQIELTTANDETSDPGAKLRMQKVREPYNKVLDSLYELITKARAREVRNIQKIEANLANSNADMAMGGRPVDDEDYDTTEVEQRKATAQVQIDSVKSMVTIQVSILQKAISFAWVALMRACRRIQGKGMPGERAGGFRTILTEARKKGRITSDVYIQSALIEYHCYKDNTATKIFERGIKLFPDDEIFALEYIKHLIAINDVTSGSHRSIYITLY